MSGFVQKLSSRKFLGTVAFVATMVAEKQYIPAAIVAGVWILAEAGIDAAATKNQTSDGESSSTTVTLETEDTVGALIDALQTARSGNEKFDPLQVIATALTAKEQKK